MLFGFNHLFFPAAIDSFLA